MSTKSRSAKRLKRNKTGAGAERCSRDPIAIIGIGCRFPGGVQNPTDYWRMLRDGVDCISEIPKDRWDIDEFYRPDQGIRGMSYAKRGGFVDGIDLFEPEVFGISPREAPYIDPQQRLLLEAVWEALEDAGLPLADLDGSPTGVYVGISTDDYAHLQASADDRPEMSPHSMTGGAFSIAANRISYCFNLKGPSIAVDTACSSSLIAVHLACNSIWDGGCELALAGGVNVIILPSVFIGFSSM
jgi:acyl transferase domain-containing protein